MALALPTSDLPSTAEKASAADSRSRASRQRRRGGPAGREVRTLTGRAVVPGSAEGTALVTREPISLWGGLNAQTGEIIDRRHERSGEIVTGRVFVLPQGRGSSTASAILLESVKTGKAPAAIINARLDPILALGSILADELYHKPVPIVVLSQADFDSIREGNYLIIRPDGTVQVKRGKAHRGRSSCE
jgi:predicted aconitase with swiveling domain